MPPPRISIDLSDSPLKVGGFLLGKYTVAGGSKGIKLTGGGTSTTREEVVAVLEDARNVVKGFFNAASFDSTVVVVPNNTSNRDKNNIISHGRQHGFSITQVIYEQVAVSAAYIEKVRPSEKTTLVIISLTGGIVDVSVITLVPLDIEHIDYHLTLEAHKFHHETIDFDELKHQQEGVDGGVDGPINFVEGEVEEFVVDPLEKAFDILNDMLRGLKLQLNSKVEKLVFVGRASEKVRQASKESFPQITMWRGDEEIEEIVAHSTKELLFYHLQKVRGAAHENFPNIELWDGNEMPEEMAAYGAAFLSSIDKRLLLSQPGEPIIIPHGSTNWRDGVVTTRVYLSDSYPYN